MRAHGVLWHAQADPHDDAPVLTHERITEAETLGVFPEFEERSERGNTNPLTFLTTVQTPDLWQARPDAG